MTNLRTFVISHAHCVIEHSDSPRPDDVKHMQVHSTAITSIDLSSLHKPIMIFLDRCVCVCVYVCVCVQICADGTGNEESWKEGLVKC